MQNHLTEYVRSVRRSKGLSVRELAIKMGYQNLNRGMRRINEFEQCASIATPVFEKLARALELDRAEMRELARKDRDDVEREFKHWAEKPITPFLTLRPYCAVYIRQDLPDSIQTEPEAIDYAAKVAKERGMKVCLTMTRKKTFWFSEQGEFLYSLESTPENSMTPFLSLGGRKRPFVFGFDDADS